MLPEETYQTHVIGARGRYYVGEGSLRLLRLRLSTGILCRHLYHSLGINLHFWCSIWTAHVLVKLVNSLPPIFFLLFFLSFLFHRCPCTPALFLVPSFAVDLNVEKWKLTPAYVCLSFRLLLSRLNPHTTRVAEPCSLFPCVHYQKLGNSWNACKSHKLHCCILNKMMELPPSHSKYHE